MLLTSHFFDQARTRVFSALVLIALCALAPLTLSAQAEPEEEEEDFGPVYVRRFSAGARLRYLPLETIDSGTLNRAVTDTVLFRAVNDPQSAHFSYGMTTQVAVTNKWAVAVEALTHRIKYQEMRDVTTFFIDPFDNILLETQLETEDENTVARIWDIPILLRYYNKSRYTRGARVFFEGGLTVRRLTNIKTAIETTFSTTDFETPDSTDCCDRTPIEPANPSSNVTSCAAIPCSRCTMNTSLATRAFRHTNESRDVPSSARVITKSKLNVVVDPFGRRLSNIAVPVPSGLTS